MSTTLNTQGKPNKYYPAMEDIATIWFGKHNGESLQDVPASYLAWLYNDSEPPLREYVGKEVKSGQFTLNKKVMLANYIYNARNGINHELGSNVIK